MSLEDLRQKPIAVRRRIAIGLTASLMLVICAIGVTLPNVPQTKEEGAGESPLDSLTSLFSDIKTKFGNPFSSGDAPAPDPEAAELIFELMNQQGDVSGVLDMATSSQQATGTSSNTLENQGFPVPPSPSNEDEFML